MISVKGSSFGRFGGWLRRYPGGSEIKHQLVILNRSRRRAPNLTAAERIVMGSCTLFMNTPAERSGSVVTHPAALRKFTWEKHCGGLFELPVAA